MENKYELQIELKEPTSGYWDGGEKRFFTFVVEDITKYSNGYFAKIGSYNANFWFEVRAGVNKPMSEKQILTNALKAKQFRQVKSKAKSIKIVRI